MICLHASSERFGLNLCPQGTHSRAHSQPMSEATSRFQAEPESGARCGNEEAPGRIARGSRRQRSSERGYEALRASSIRSKMSASVSCCHSGMSGQSATYAGFGSGMCL